MIRSSGDSYPPSHILSPTSDVGQRWKSEPGLGEGFEVPVDERLIAEVTGLFVPLGFGLLKSIKEKKTKTQSVQFSCTWCNFASQQGGFSSALPFGSLSPKTHNFLPNAFKPENITLIFSSPSNSTQGSNELITF